MHIRTAFVALYDAGSELALYGDAHAADKARELGVALGSAGLGGIARVGSAAINTALAVIAPDAPVIALSPAASSLEHEKAFRLPPSSLPLIYTGRGALGADVIAIASAEAAIILGSDEEALWGILGCIGDRGLPIGILSDEKAADLHARSIARYPELIHRLFISGDPAHLVRELSAELRKQQYK